MNGDLFIFPSKYELKFLKKYYYKFGIYHQKMMHQTQQAGEYLQGWTTLLILFKTAWHALKHLIELRVVRSY